MKLLPGAVRGEGGRPPFAPVRHEAPPAREVREPDASPVRGTTDRSRRRYALCPELVYQCAIRASFYEYVRVTYEYVRVTQRFRRSSRRVG